MIPTKNSEQPLKVLLGSLAAQSLRPIEIIVVDDYSADGTGRVAESFGARFLRVRGDRSVARNAGASHAESEALVFLDSDMELEPGVLGECINSLGSHDAVVIRERVANPNSYWSRVRALEKDAYAQSLFFEAARCYRKPVFLGVGGFRSELVGLEDVDLMARVLEARMRIGWTDSHVLHHESGLTFREYLSKRAYYGRADRRFAELHPRYASVFTSPYERLKCILREYLKRRSPRDLPLLPGVVLYRGLEILSRRSGASS